MFYGTGLVLQICKISAGPSLFKPVQFNCRKNE